jgi:hypothetical protein
VESSGTFFLGDLVSIEEREPSVCRCFTSPLPVSIHCSQSLLSDLRSSFCLSFPRGVNHDMHVLGDPLPDKGLFCSRYDRIYFNAQSIAPVAVVDTLSSKPCPNDEEPSDHLPVAAAFRAI